MIIDNLGDVSINNEKLLRALYCEISQKQAEKKFNQNIYVLMSCSNYNILSYQHFGGNVVYIPYNCEKPTLRVFDVPIIKADIKDNEIKVVIE